MVANHEEKKNDKGVPYWDEKNEDLNVFETTNEIILQLYPNVDWKKAMRGKENIPIRGSTKARMKHKQLPL